MKNLKVVFMGTPEFAVPVLEGLIENYEVILVVSQPDKRVGRKQELKNTPIKEVALKHNIPVFQPVKIREDYGEIIDLNPDIIVTCAYGQIIPKVILDCPKLGCINVHASLLPKLRGGAPIHKAIINGDKKVLDVIVSPKQAEEINKKLEGLKNFLKDFSKLDERTSEEIKLWDEYLIYSVMFNQNENIVNEYKNLIIIK